MNDQSDAGNANKENKKVIRQIRIITFIVLSIFFARHYSHQYYMDQISKASADLLANNVGKRLAAVKVLRDIDEPEAKIALLTALKDKSSDVRTQAASSLFGWVDDRALAALLVAIKDKDEDVRRSVAIALLPFVRSYKSIPAATAQQMEYSSDALENAFQTRDYPAIAGGAIYFIENGKDGTEPILISALQVCGTKEMAETYLNCGNEKLETAGKQWAEKHNYWIQTQQGSYSAVIWGSKRRK